MAPVSSSISPSARVPRRPSLFCFMRSVDDKFGDILVVSLISINIFGITACFAELFEIVFGLGGGLVAFFADDAQQGLFYIHAHGFFCAADIDMRTGLEPAEQIGGLVFHFMLDIDLAGLVAGKGGIDAREYAGPDPVLDLRLIKEVGGEMAVAEEKPVPAGGALAIPLREKRAEGGDAGTGSDHDDIRIRCRKSELRVVVYIELDLFPFFQQREPIRAQAEFDLFVDMEGIPGDGEMDLIRMGFG